MLHLTTQFIYIHTLLLIKPVVSFFTLIVANGKYSCKCASVDAFFM